MSRQRITQKQMQALLDRLNTIAGTPLTTFDPDRTEARWNVGNFHLDSAYNGFCLMQVVSPRGAVENVLGTAYAPLSQTYRDTQIFIRGLCFKPRTTT